MKNSTATILILISIGLFYTFISQQYDNVKILRDEQVQYQNALDKVGELVTTRDDLLIKYNNFLQTDISKLEKIIPNNSDNVRLAMDIDSLASKYGISIKSVKVIEDTKGDSVTTIDLSQASRAYLSLKISFSFVSSYSNFIKFVKDLERSMRVIDIKSVSFQSSDTGLYTYNITIQTYWLK